MAFRPAVAIPLHVFALGLVLSSCGATLAIAQGAFLSPPERILLPGPEHSATNRAFQGIPSMAIAPAGRIWATWYAGITPGEDHNNYVVITTSGDGGKTWNEALVIDPDGPGPVRAFDPEMWMSPDGRLFAFWAQAQGHEGSVAGVWCIETDQPDAAKPIWSKPRRIADGIMMCKPTVLSRGEWLLPVSTWRKTDNSARVIQSSDQGENWELLGACHVPEKDRQFDEHMVVERQDGSLWMLVRTNYGIGESVSVDRGKSWPILKPSLIAHPSARFFITRLQSGNLLLVKHGPVKEKTGRSHLTAYVSSNDGADWFGGLLLDERNGVSYPDGQQTPDGKIHIVYDYSRTGERKILMASFTESDVAKGSIDSDSVELRKLVSQASGGQEKAASKPVAVSPNPEGKPLLLPVKGGNSVAAGQWEDAGYKTRLFEVDQVIFTDRKYKIAESPGVLKTAQFLQVPLDGSKRLTCSQSGLVAFLTPQANRNSDSQSANLIDQGFELVALPEIRLFDPSNSGNYCSLYQKTCAAGEVITFGKWAVPVIFP
ncbi:MAG TPA: exo-alpha-sialidase [Planctomycetaceae bacterium]|nr:exo-alpha-sialidase [Planctomycetaceae bacterium]